MSVKYLFEGLVMFHAYALLLGLRSHSHLLERPFFNLSTNDPNSPNQLLCHPYVISIIIVNVLHGRI